MNTKLSAYYCCQKAFFKKKKMEQILTVTLQWMKGKCHLSESDSQESSQAMINLDIFALTLLLKTNIDTCLSVTFAFANDKPEQPSLIQNA